METSGILNKFRLLFQKLSEPGYVLDNYYGDSLINKLSSGDTDPEIAAILKFPVVSELITDALEHLEKAHLTVKVFIVRLCSIMMRDELQFSKICLKGKDTFIKAFNDLNSVDKKPSLKVAYVELALALVEHASGISLLLESEAWKSILKLCDNNQTVFVVRQTYKFTGKFLWQLNALSDKNNINNVLKVILEPIFDNDFFNMNSISAEEENKLSQTLVPMLHMLLSLFNDSHRICQSTLLINTLVYQYTINTYLYVLMDRFHKKEVMFLLSKLVFWTVLAKCFVENPVIDGICYERTNLMDLSVAYFNVIMKYISRGDATSILDYCNACNIIWAQVWRGKMCPIFENSKGEKIQVQQTLIILQLVPIVVYIKNTDPVKFDTAAAMNSPECDVLSQYISRLMSSTCEHTLRCCYSLKSLVETNCLSITLQSVKRLSCLKNHLNNEQATLIFQTLFYVLQYYDPNEGTDAASKSEELYEESEEKVQVMTYVMDNIGLLLKNFNIHWKESIEVLGVYATVYSILVHRRNLSCKFVVSSLSVIALTVRKFQPPNLSLLVDTQPGSSIHELARLVHTKMHDASWEVRDSALELLLVCTEIAFIKFPPFQKQIVENQLIVLAATMALNDHEYYVQASALKCLAAATKVNSLWEQLITEHPDIHDKLISIIHHNQEGIVRKEAVHIFSSMHQNIKLQDTFKHTLYDHMVSTALTDFHWEAQIAALQFWKVVIQSHLTEQGMLDGTFPPVTFSKETRKIVTLNEQEIQRRLTKAMEEISAIGILTILVKLLQDDIEIPIMEQALSISRELLDLLNQYKVSEVLKSSEQDKESLNDVLCTVVNTEEITTEAMADEADTKADEVIDGIVNCDDINLLAIIYESQMKLQSGKAPRKVIPNIKLLKYVSPAAFMSFITSKDFKAIIEQKRRWNDGIVSLPSLLEDVLGIYELNEEVNTMDCY